MTLDLDPVNEDPAFQDGKPKTSYVTRMRWMQSAIQGKGIGGLTGVNHGWYGDWLGIKIADTADFGIELYRHLAQISHIYAPGSELRSVNGWARFATNLYVSHDVWDVKQALILKAQSIDRLVHTFFNGNRIVYAEFGVWLPPVGKAYNLARATGAAAKEVESWPGTDRVMFYAPVGDKNYELVRMDGSEVANRVSGYMRGLGR